MNWDDLRVVSAIYKAGSFARAAQALHLDKTTIGRRLARIEAAFGRPPDRSGASGEPDAGRIAAKGVLALAHQLQAFIPPAPCMFKTHGLF